MYNTVFVVELIVDIECEHGKWTFSVIYWGCGVNCNLLSLVPVSCPCLALCAILSVHLTPQHGLSGGKLDHQCQRPTSAETGRHSVCYPSASNVEMGCHLKKEHQRFGYLKKGKEEKKPKASHVLAPVEKGGDKKTHTLVERWYYHGVNHIEIYCLKKRATKDRLLTA